MTTATHRQPLDVLLRRASRTVDGAPEFDFSTPIDRSCWFVCPTLTPLYYTQVYRDLSKDQQRRYNQLTALSFNELIAFFENTFASSVLSALTDARLRRVNNDLAACLSDFIADERKHIDWWQQLNRLSEPEVYANTNQYIIHFPAYAQKLLGAIAARPNLFPVAIWIMLALEERSLDISNRTLRMDPALIEPRYRLIYQQHLKDESRHVQLDWHLIELFYAKRSWILRKCNAKLLGLMMSRLFLPPTRSAVRVVHCLVTQHPELAPLAPKMTQQLRQLGGNPEYQEMMYSRDTTPILFSLFDRFEEMSPIRHVLRSYVPQKEGASGGRKN